MKTKSYPQFAIIERETLADLNGSLNALLRTLDYPIESIEFENQTVRVKYIVTERDIPEDLSDEYRVKGVRLTCEDCPWFEPARKADGTVDHRKKRGGCPFHNGGMAYSDSSACEILFNAINNKEVALCLPTQE